MSKGNRIKQQHVLEKEQQERQQAILNIIESLTPSKREIAFGWFIRKWNLGKVKRLAREVYGFNLMNETKWFIGVAVSEYISDKKLKSFGSFHLTMITKCNTMDTKWENYLTENGKAI